MTNEVDKFYVEQVRSMIADAGNKLEKAQSYAAEAGFSEEMFPQKDLKKILNAMHRLSDNLIFYMVKKAE